MIRTSKNFTYNGISSEQMNIINVNVSSSGMLEEAFSFKRNIVEEKIKGRSEPYFQLVESEPLELTLDLAFTVDWTESILKNIRKWLIQPYYKPLIFSDNPNEIYYAMVDSEPIIIHNGSNQGYLKVTMRCNSPYKYSPVYSYAYNFPTSPGTFNFNNSGDVECIPKFVITKFGAGDVSITRTNDSNFDVFGFTGLASNEIITVYNNEKIIQTDLSTTYRYNAFNKNWFAFPTGLNNFTVTGACNLLVVYQFRYL